MPWKPADVILRLWTPDLLTEDEVRAVIPSWTPGGYVEAYDPKVGLASLTVTPWPKRALKLDSRAAFDLWQSSPVADPVRPDGRPNRPLTAFTVEFTRYQPDPWLN